MSRRSKAAVDPLAARVHQAVEKIDELRSQVENLEQQLDQAHKSIANLEADRGTVRQRVQRMLQYIGG